MSTTHRIHDPPPTLPRLNTSISKPVEFTDTRPSYLEQEHGPPIQSEKGPAEDGRRPLFPSSSGVFDIGSVRSYPQPCQDGFGHLGLCSIGELGEEEKFVQPGETHTGEQGSVVENKGRSELIGRAEEVEKVQKDLNQDLSGSGISSHPPLRTPVPKLHANLQRTRSDPQHQTSPPRSSRPAERQSSPFRQGRKHSTSMDRQGSRSRRDVSGGSMGRDSEDYFNSALGFSTTRSASRSSSSATRPHLFNALSPLQAFSPLQPIAQPISGSTSPLPPSKDPSGSPGSSVGAPSLSRSSSVTRSLSRRQSLIAHAARWDKGEYVDENLTNPMALFSRLTLVKAPQEKQGIRRARSSSALSPFTGPTGIPDNTPATSARGPRRSFAASSFAGLTPLSSNKPIEPEPFSPHGPDAAHRISHLAGVDSGGESGMGLVHKTLSPEQVVEIARGTYSPVAVPEGGFKGAELKRRKSSGSSHFSSRRSIGSNADLPSPEDKPPMVLEPVEYVQMDDDTLLPFVDRPVEVLDLLEQPSNEQLVKLLQAAFPRKPLREHWIALVPEEWYWDEVWRHLTGLTRIDCPDYAWVFRARQAVRARSVMLWEKLGTCLGCDPDLLNAGGEDGIPNSWGGLGLGEEGDYDPSQNQVVIEALEAVDPDEAKELERQLREEFGDIVEDEGAQAAAGMTALLGTIGEGEEPSPTENPNSPVTPSRMTTAQRSARAPISLAMDPLAMSPDISPHLSRALPRTTPASPRLSSSARGVRSKSFVGLQILTSPRSNVDTPLTRSPSSTINAFTPMMETLDSGTGVPYDRGPGNPLFPSSFSSLSVGPNLGRSASVGLAGGIKAAPETFGRVGNRRWSGMVARQSGAGMSESAITFASESDPGMPVETN